MINDYSIEAFHISGDEMFSDIKSLRLEQAVEMFKLYKQYMENNGLSFSVCVLIDDYHFDSHENISPEAVFEWRESFKKYFDIEIDFIVSEKMLNKFANIIIKEIHDHYIKKEIRSTEKNLYWDYSLNNFNGQISLNICHSKYLNQPNEEVVINYDDPIDAIFSGDYLDDKKHVIIGNDDDRQKFIDNISVFAKKNNSNEIWLKTELAHHSWYSCSLLAASWYLLRLNKFESSNIKNDFILYKNTNKSLYAKTLLNILSGKEYLIIESEIQHILRTIRKYEKCIKKINYTFF